MRMRLLRLICTSMAAAATPLMAQTVSVSLNSPEGGDTVSPGARIHWSIDASVSADDNAGLALLIVDLTQDNANPQRIDIPPADEVPAEMVNFSRPAGISNPGETDPLSGFTGVQRGTAGAMNLRQIGGAQNTFGEAQPFGNGIAENAVIVAGIGQGGGVTLASGSFAAPATPGTYIFRIEHPVANVLSIVNALPLFSPVERATTNVAAASLTFTVSDVPCEACDANCDGASDGRDLQWFTASLLSSSPQSCSPCAGDMDGSGDVTVADIGPFVACQLGA